ncbi:MAG: extracellular solute-binding protein [Lachnospirales bacterium]
MKRNVNLKKSFMLGASLFVLSFAVACSNGDSQQETNVDSNASLEAENVTDGETDEITEISLAIWNADQALSGDEVLDTIESKLNINITPVNVTWDDYSQKLQLWASSGSLPDVFAGALRDSFTYPQWIDQGVVKEIPENLDVYPTLNEYLSGQAAQESKLNGKLYCIPRQTYPSQEWSVIDRVVVYRWDLAQQAGITEEPKNWSEFNTMMEAIINEDSLGTSITGMTSGGRDLPYGAIMPYGMAINANKWVMDDDGLYKPAYFVEDVVAGFQLARDMYTSGIIENDIALVTGTSGIEKFLQGKSAAITLAAGFGGTYESLGRYWEDIYGRNYLDDVRALDLMPDVNGNPAYATTSIAWSESYISSAVDDNKLNKILELYDYLLTDDGSFLSNYGPEGELYEMVDGKAVLTDPSIIIKDVYPSTEALGVLARWNPSTYDDRFVLPTPTEYIEIDLNRVEQGKNVVLPEYNQRCTELVSELGIEFTISYFDDFFTIMTGTEPVEDMWNDMLDKYEDDGLSDVIKQVNDALY